MKKLKILFFLLLAGSISAFSINYEVKTFKLENGLTVILNEDHTQTEVYGAVAVKAGGANDPSDATGLAHYLEHVLFNGTTNVGTVNWEAEKVHYEKVIELFETLRITEDEDQRTEIIKQINETSIAQSEYFQTKEFVLLLESIGTSGINAGTSYDYTYFHSTFPPQQTKAWLEIYANEFTKPIFRNFQAELETVYEEYNMYAEDPMSNFVSKSFSNMWEGSPYEKEVIGYSEHLKSPSLARLIEFFNTWYVPENMALVLVGDFDPTTIEADIKATFGKWEAKPLTKDGSIEKVALQKKKRIKLRETPYNVGMWSFNAPYVGDNDYLKMNLLVEILSNSASIGVLDQLQTDGDVMQIQAFYQPLKSASMCGILAIPNYDMAQMRQMVPSEIDDLIFDKIDEIKDGKIDEKLLTSVRDNYIRNYSVEMESYPQRANMFLDFFTTNREPELVNSFFDELGKITVEDIVATANKYLTDVYVEVTSSRGNIKLKEIEKPEIDPVIQKVEAQSEFAKHMNTRMETEVGAQKYIDFTTDIQRTELAEKVALFYKNNTQNDIFNLRIYYKVGTSTIPTLGFAAQLMNNAGVRGNYKPHELKKRFGELGCAYRFSADANNLIVTISGREKNLEEACKLISMVTLMPALDIKQYNSLIGAEMNNRDVQKQDFQSIAAAASQYLIYGKNSPYIDRLSWDELSEININSLTGDFIEATKYEASVHYFGNTAFEESKERLLNSLAFASGRQAAPELFTREINKPTENMVYLVNKPGTLQSKITVMVPALDNYSIDKDAEIEAYSKYFGQGLGNIFFQEIREFRSMAYSARASVHTPDVTGKPAFMVGTVDTQGDKTNDAVSIIHSLIKEMPLKAHKAESVKNNLMFGSITSRPSDRYLTYYIEQWEDLGYTEDPTKVNQVNYEHANMDFINKFYTENIQQKPIAIVIVGDKKKIDTKELAKLGTYEFLKSSKLFNE
jgi:zinc protease